MIHISELSWDVVMTPESVVQQGTPVRCAVLDVNVPKARISLSLKRLQVQPL
jgi:4-hydroxy-3-methylbut-2-enyl diphosphate reductase